MIAIAKQEGNYVKLFDEKGGYMFCLTGELQGYTATTVSVKEGTSIKVFDDKGAYKFCR